jgi:hypothetical protein
MNGLRSIKNDRSMPGLELPFGNTFSSPNRGSTGTDGGSRGKPLLGQCFPSAFSRPLDSGLNPDLEINQCAALAAMVCSTPKAHLLLTANIPPLERTPSGVLQSSVQNITKFFPIGVQISDLRLSDGISAEEMCKALLRAELARHNTPPPQQEPASTKTMGSGAPSLAATVSNLTAITGGGVVGHHHHRRHIRQISTVSSEGFTERMSSLSTDEQPPPDHPVYGRDVAAAYGAKSILVLHDLHLANKECVGPLVDALYHGRTKNSAGEIRYIPHVRIVAVCDGQRLEELPTLVRGGFVVGMSLPYSTICAGGISGRRASTIPFNTISNFMMTTSSILPNLISPSALGELMADPDKALDNSVVYLPAATTRYFEQCAEIVRCSTVPGVALVPAFHSRLPLIHRALRVLTFLFSRPFLDDEPQLEPDPPTSGDPDVGGGNPLLRSHSVRVMVPPAAISVPRPEGGALAESVNLAGSTMERRDASRRTDSRRSKPVRPRRLLVSPNDAVSVLPLFLGHLISVPVRLFAEKTSREVGGNPTSSSGSVVGGLLSATISPSFQFPVSQPAQLTAKSGSFNAGHLGNAGGQLKRTRSGGERSEGRGSNDGRNPEPSPRGSLKSKAVTAQAKGSSKSKQNQEQSGEGRVSGGGGGSSGRRVQHLKTQSSISVSDSEGQPPVLKRVGSFGSGEFEDPLAAVPWDIHLLTARESDYANHEQCIAAIMETVLTSALPAPC